MKQIEGTFKGAGGVSLFWQGWQPAGDVQAVMAIVHGFGEHSGRYKNVVDHFVPAGYAVYSFDLRGHGRSPGQRGHVNSWAEYRGDVRAFVNWVAEQQPNVPLVLLGHSMGGLIVLDYTLHHPQGLVAVVASAPLLGLVGVSPILVKVGQLVSKIRPTFSMDAGLDIHGISRDSTVVQAYQADPLVHGLISVRLGAEMNRIMAQTKAQAADFQPPLLIIHGDADRLTSHQESRAFFEQVSLPTKRYISYPGGYHESFNDLHHQQAVSDVAAWVAGVREG